MAYFFRLIFAFLFFTTPAFADFPATSETVWNWEYNPSVNHLTPQLACDFALSSYQTAQPSEGWSSATVSGSGLTSKTCTLSSPGSSFASAISATIGLVCPGYSTIVGSMCTCDSGFTQVGESCVSGTDQLCTLLAGTETYATSPGALAPGASSCNASGCLTTFSDTLIRVRNAQGVEVTEGAATFTGASCTYSPDSGSTNDTCPNGSTGEINGVVTCIPYDPNLNTIETISNTTETTTDGTDTTSTSTTSTTTCTNGSCTTTNTTTTIVNGVAGPPKTTTTEQPQTEFCKTNPTAAVCAKPGQFAGSCGAFSCTGDGIQCAIAKEIHVQNCKLNQSTTESALYDSSKTKNGSVTGDLPGSESIAFGPGSINTTNLLGSQTCISDKTVTVVGHSVNLPFSSVCRYLEVLGSILVSVSFLLAGRIIVRG
jgi:hypothetical protein